jgi:hypothetical protein
LAGASREAGRRFAPGLVEIKTVALSPVMQRSAVCGAGEEHSQEWLCHKKPEASGEERRCDVENMLSLEGPVLKVNGELLLLIPLADTSSEAVERSRGISEVQGEFLKIVIPEWLAGMLEIEEGDLVRVDSDGTLDVKLPDPGLVN